MASPLSPQPSTQSHEQRATLSRSYAPDALYVALHAVQAQPGDPMGLTLREGDLVAIIKRADPMGNPNRWFVDSGAAKGFVQASALNPYNSPPPYNFVVGSGEGSLSSGIITKEITCALDQTP